jgi:hypothetical protein
VSPGSGEDKLVRQYATDFFVVELLLWLRNREGTLLFPLLRRRLLALF